MAGYTSQLEPRQALVLALLPFFISGLAAIYLAVRYRKAPGSLVRPMRWAMPASLRRLGRRGLRRPAAGPPAFLDYDLRAIARALEARGLRCRVEDFPADYWSTDFRSTRSNLLITVAHS